MSEKIYIQNDEKEDLIEKSEIMLRFTAMLVESSEFTGNRDLETIVKVIQVLSEDIYNRVMNVCGMADNTQNE